jgi:hypothetical protein
MSSTCSATSRTVSLRLKCFDCCFALNKKIYYFTYGVFNSGKRHIFNFYFLSPCVPTPLLCGPTIQKSEDIATFRPTCDCTHSILNFEGEREIFLKNQNHFSPQVFGLLQRKSGSDGQSDFSFHLSFLHLTILLKRNHFQKPSVRKREKEREREKERKREKKRRGREGR